MSATAKRRRTARLTAAVAVAAYGVLLLIGLVVVLHRTPRPTTPSVMGVERCSTADLAHYCRGVSAKVSSFHAFGSHHPLFAIDGRRSRDLLEKWVSAPHDRAPWIELAFPEPTDFSVVRLAFAGTVEPRDYDMRSYRITCSRGGAPHRSLEVRANEDSVPTHTLDCTSVDRLRIDFATEPGTERDVVRLFEVEVRP